MIDTIVIDDRFSSFFTEKDVPFYKKIFQETDETHAAVSSTCAVNSWSDLNGLSFWGDAIESTSYNRNLCWKSVIDINSKGSDFAQFFKYFGNVNLDQNNQWLVSIIEAKKEIDPVYKQLSGRIYSLRLPERWVGEKVLPPNYFCKELTERVVHDFYNQYSLYPQRIEVSIEEGIILKYNNFDNGRELLIEIYNDSEIAALINSNNRIVISMDIIDEDFSNIVKVFYE